MFVYRSMILGLGVLLTASPVLAEGEKMSVKQETQQVAPQVVTISKINVNQATVRDLMKVKGINASRARAIVAYRKKHGAFKAVQDIGIVKGFKKMKAARLQEVESQLSID